MEWTDLTASGVMKGTIPYPRGNHKMTTVGKDIYLYGGFNSFMKEDFEAHDFFKFSTETMEWTDLSAAGIGTKPSTIGLIGLMAMTSVGKDVYIHGGEENDICRLREV
jgi:N-acetylneuraminic acid mutarotase